ncbi:tRNA (guanosine(37)-N1)-methyltransferase TrmD [bacterium]|nr:tRNA (guanosine(37)-N1)-methyltransferase TrmD [bacterium]
MLRIDIVTLFPDYFQGVLGLSIPARAAREGLVAYRTVQLRDFAVDRHGTVDDYPYGGGSGMVIRPDPVFDAVEYCRGEEPQDREKTRVVLLSARGERFDQRLAERFSLLDRLVLVCGHYKDVDERVAVHLVDQEVRVGDYVLTGGEPAAALILDAVVRLIPGALGDFGSATEDSFFENLLGAPQYTRPADYRGLKVPEVLTSGDHARIEAWRQAEALRLTRERRPDLLAED